MRSPGDWPTRAALARTRCVTAFLRGDLVEWRSATAELEALCREAGIPQREEIIIASRQKARATYRRNHEVGKDGIWGRSRR